MHLLAWAMAAFDARYEIMPVPALMAATLFADARTVKLLLEHGADPNRADASGATALMWAIPDVEKVQLLLARGANVNARSATERTPLLVASSYPGTADLLRLLLDHGAYFPNCNYNYANTRTAPGHSTLFTGAYSNGHGIAANEWWDQKKKRMVTSVEDDATKLVGVNGDKTGASPHNLLADTLGDELKLATQGKARVFGVSLKDRAAVLPAGFAADGAYWIDRATGVWITST